MIPVRIAHWELIVNSSQNSSLIPILFSLKIINIEDVIEKFNTDLIPPKLCSDVKRFNANSAVNITSIVVENLRGERKLVPSMQIIPVY